MPPKANAKAVAKAGAKGKKKKEQESQAKEEPKVKECGREFLAHVCAASGLTNLRTQDVAKLIEGVRKTLVNDIQHKGGAKLPNIATFKLRSLKARPAGQRPMFGVMRPVAARAECKKVSLRFLKSFKLAVNSI